MNDVLCNRSCGQVQAAAEVPAAPNHLGWRGDRLLLQGEVKKLPQGHVQSEQVSQPSRNVDKISIQTPNVKCRLQ